jgi:hypothetical protein
MDNGLIFPYRQNSAHDEPGNAKRPKRIVNLRVDGVVERVNQAGSSQAMG